MSNTHADRRLTLVKHAAPVVVPGVPPSQWLLSDEGRRSCATLASRLAAYRPTVVAASDEPKARETAELLAAGLGYGGAIWLDHDLREHERRPTDFFAAQGDFHAAVRALFARPDDRVFGVETATAARSRFEAAYGRLLDAAPDGDVIVVAHGTVISLFVAAHAGLDPFPLWRRLGLPSYIVLALPDWRVVEIVSEVGR